VDLDTGKELPVTRTGGGGSVPLAVPITNDRQSAHLKLTGTLAEGYRLQNNELVFDMTLRGLRNTVLLPEGWNLTGSNQSGTIGTYRGRTFVSFVNLNSENNYRVTMRAMKDAK
jgi:hypothetical protein